jgi:hypothetical protein
LALVKTEHSGALDGADVNEHILASVIRLYKTEAFLAVEPLYGSLRHETFLSGMCLDRLHRGAAGFVVIEILEEGRQSDA